MGYEISFNNYTGSLGNPGFRLREFFSDLQAWNKELVLKDEESLFYAKGFFDSQITDKIYYFNSNLVKIVNLNEDKDQKLSSVSIRNVKVSDIKETILTIKSQFEVELTIEFKDGEKLNFNNKNDSNEKQIDALRKRIIEIYKVLNK